MNTLTIIVVMALAGLLGALGQVSFKRGSGQFAPRVRAIAGNKAFLLGVLCYGLATLIFLAVLKYAPLSYAYPLVSITYVWVAILSALLLKEHIGTWKITGIILIVTGIVLINL